MKCPNDEDHGKMEVEYENSGTFNLTKYRCSTCGATELVQ